jgi:hypothetical protein
MKAPLVVTIWSTQQQDEKRAAQNDPEEDSKPAAREDDPEEDSKPAARDFVGYKFTPNPFLSADDSQIDNTPSRILPYAAMPDQQDIDDDEDPFKGMNLASAACIRQSMDANLVFFADNNSQRLSFVFVFRSIQ